jgi:hypothetical protein
MGVPNFTLLDSSLPEIGRLISAMRKRAMPSNVARGRIRKSRQAKAGRDGVLADPLPRKRQRRTDLAVKRAF